MISGDDRGMRMERLTAALCASLVLLQGCALFAPKHSHASTPALRSRAAFVDGVTFTRDPSTHRASLRLILGVSGRRLIVTSNPERRPERFELGMQRPSTVPLYQGCRRVDLVIDTYHRTVAGHAAFARGGRHGVDGWEALSAPVLRETLQQVAVAGAAEFRACHDRLVLDERHRTWLRIYLKRWQEVAAQAPTQQPPEAVAIAEQPVAAAPVASEPTSPSAPQPPAPTPVVVDGCKFDLQCKGDRICVAGSCIDPPAKALPAGAATK